MCPSKRARPTAEPSNQEAALYYWRMGWYPIPCCRPADTGGCLQHGPNCRRPGKWPLVGWKNLETTPPTVDQVRDWWTRWPDANIGILLKPSGLAVLDADSQEAVNEVETALDAHGLRAPRASTGSGAHFFFSANGEVPRKIRAGKSRKIDLLSSGYVMVEPSRHRSGSQYTWTIDPGGDTPPTLPDWMLQLLGARGGADTVGGTAKADKIINGTLLVDKTDGRLKPRTEVREVDRSETLAALAGELTKSGLGETEIARTLEDADTRLGFEKYADRPEEYVRLAAKARTQGWGCPAQDVDPDGQQKDYGHAAVLARLFKDRYRWAVHRGGWMRYDGKVWRPLPEAAVAKEAADALRLEYAAALAAAKSRDAIQELTSKTRETTVYSRIQGALNFLRGWPGIITMSDEWDADPWLLNVNNGTLDLRTCTLRPHDPADLCTKLAPVDYDPTAKGPYWERHINRFQPNPNIRRQIQRDLGRALPGVTLEETLPVWYGTGANGKTTTARVLMKVLGDYADRAAPNLLVQSKYERHPTEIADLCGLRLAFSVEVDQGKHLAEALVKELTGGDRKKGRFMRQDFFSFEQSFTIVLVVNHKPLVTGTDEGIWRRIKLIPWQHRIPDNEKVPQDTVVGQMVAEGPAILNWLLDGLRDWQADHTWVAPEVRAASDAYRAEMDVLGDFIRDRCVLDPRRTVPKGELYQAYTSWCENNHEQPLGKKEFISRLQDRGIGERKGAKGVRLHVGIGLLTTRVAVGGADSISPRETKISKGDTEHAPPSATRRWNWVADRC